MNAKDLENQVKAEAAEEAVEAVTEETVTEETVETENEELEVKEQ